MAGYRPSADRAEYSAALAGGYADRLTNIFKEAAARAAAAAAEAERTGSLPPWILRDPSNDTPDVFDVSKYPVMEPTNPLDTSGTLPWDQVVPDAQAAPNGPVTGPGAGGILMDDYEAAAKAAIATGQDAYFRNPDGTTGVVTPQQAYYDGLEVSADRMTTPVGGDVPFLATAPGSQTQYDAQGNIIPIEDRTGLPERYPKDPITGEDLPPQVFLGFLNNQVDGPPGARILSGYNAQFLPSDQVKNFSTLPRDLVNEIVNMANAYYGRPVDPSWIRGRWAEAVDEAAEAYQINGILISPLEVYDDLIAGAAAADAAAAASYTSGYGSYGGGGGGGGGGSVSLTNYTTAKAILNQAMSAWLGRQASEAEVSNFLALLNEQEKANPVVQDFSGDIAIQSGGFDPQQFAEDFAKAQPGSGEYQAVTTYLDAFLSALSSRGGVL